MTEWFEKQDPSVCERPSLVSRTYIDSKKRDGKGYSMQMETKRERE